MSLNGPKFPRKADGTLDLEAFKLLSPEMHTAIRDNMNDAEKLEAQLAFRASAATKRLQQEANQKQLEEALNEYHQSRQQFENYINTNAQKLVAQMKSDSVQPTAKAKKSCCSIM